MPDLVPGQNMPIAAAPTQIRLTAGAPADFSAFLLYENGKTRADGDFVFYGQTACPDRSVRLSAGTDKATFDVDLVHVSQAVQKIVFSVTSDYPALADLRSLELTLSQPGSTLLECRPGLAGRKEAALILGEIYRHKGDWKFRFVDQGYNGGLKPLAESFGVEIAEDAKPAPKVSLSKITLTKDKPAVDLEKHDLEKGVYRVNLNWNQKPAGKNAGLGRFFGRETGIDLDLGAYVRLKDGDQTIVQALGNTFGSLDRFPYVKLLGDDRTGAQAEGEWLEINGAKLDEISEIIIFAFIYSGVPNWAATDAKVRIEFSGLPEVETALSEGNNSRSMCAIARIVNEGGRLRIERLNRYYSGHREMDKDFGWGFSWQKGTKD